METDISDADFHAICELVYDRFGIHLTGQKRNLVVGRLQKVLRARGFATYKDYIACLRNDATGEAISELIDRISTNHTFFFREPQHFAFLAERLLPELCAQPQVERSRDLRIWSAGCSSGEEPYTFAIALREYFGQAYSQWKAGVLATDISSHVLRHAQRGIFPLERLAQTTDAIRKRYFSPAGEGLVAVRDDLRGDVTFRRLNLMSQTYPFKAPFHLISCRNVMIYFDGPTRAALVARYHANLVPGGYLFIGHSESLGRDDRLFEYVQPAVYRKK
jgi:chemotaxis protein methyltransferase CheR